MLADRVKAFEFLNYRVLKAWFVSLTETKLVLWMGVSINFSSPPKHETTSACYVWPRHLSSRNLGSTPISEAHPRAGGRTQASPVVKPQPSGGSTVIFAEHKTRTTRYSETTRMNQTAAKAFKGGEPAGPGGVGCRGETEVRARRHSGWQTVPGGVGRKVQDVGRQEHATDTKVGMPVRAPTAPG